MMNSDDSKPGRDQVERDEAIADRVRAATDRAASAEDRGREVPDAGLGAQDAESTTPVTAAEYGHLVDADERDARADADDRAADERDARAAITDQLAGDEPNRDRGSAAIDRASAAGDRNFAAQDRRSALRDHYVTSSEATETAALGRIRAAGMRDHAASRRDSAAAARDESAAILDEGDLEGVVLGAVVSWADAEAELKAVARLRKFEEHYRLLAANATNVVWELDCDAVLQWVSPSVESVLGWTPTQLIETKPMELVHQVDHNVLKEGLADALAGHETPQFESRILTAEGSYRWLSIQLQPTMDADGLVSGVIVGLRDVHAEVVAREQVAHSERMFRLAMEGAPQGMAVVGLHLKFLEVNAVLCDMLGRDEDWFLRHTIADVVHPDDLETDLVGRDELLSGAREKLAYEHRWLRAGGSVLWVMHSTGLVRDDEKMPLFFMSHVQDVSQAHHANERLGYEAHHDALTGLMNRHELEGQITEILQRSPRRAGGVGVLFCDVDDFKVINDTHGHPVGDEVLQITAQRVASTSRAGDIVARLGGDEFVIVLHDVRDVDAASAVAQKILLAVRQPFSVGAAEIAVTISIGIALAGPDTDPYELLKNADVALYRAKRSGHNQAAIYSGS